VQEGAGGGASGAFLLLGFLAALRMRRRWTTAARSDNSAGMALARRLFTRE
jgi:MYXO-CTERM domain-containing protein